MSIIQIKYLALGMLLHIIMAVVMIVQEIMNRKTHNQHTHKQKTCYFLMMFLFYQLFYFYLVLNRLLFLKRNIKFILYVSSINLSFRGANIIYFLIIQEKKFMPFSIANVPVSLLITLMSLPELLQNKLYYNQFNIQGERIDVNMPFIASPIAL